jgi:hypothetical protein
MLRIDSILAHTVRHSCRITTLPLHATLSTYAAAKLIILDPFGNSLLYLAFRCPYGPGFPAIYLLKFYRPRLPDPENNTCSAFD